MTILNRATKLRLHRGFRHKQMQVERAAFTVETEFDKKVIHRFGRLRHVRRFVASWILLMVALMFVVSMQTVGLNHYYLKSGAVPGGVYNGGIIGTFSNANPIYAVGSVDTAVSRLLFAGLLRYDNSNTLSGDLAKDFSVDESGKIYTVNLKPNLRWHDGKPLTAKDVIFTFQTIQNPDTKSPLFASWQGVTITSTGDRTVKFQLNNALTAFPHSLTTGILPEHILGSVKKTALRSHIFNTTQPVGAGPFMWSALQLGATAADEEETATISLKAFPHYNRGKPKLDGFALHTYERADGLLAAYRQKSIEAAAGLQELPEDIAKDPKTNIYRFPNTAAVMVFFKTSEGLLADTTLRKALVLAADRDTLLKKLGYPVKPVRSPLLTSHLGYDAKFDQAGYNQPEAEKILQDAGWTMGKDGVRTKDKKRLQFQLLAEDTADNRAILLELQRQWKKVGVDMQPSWQQNTADMQGAVESHGYTALLYGIGIGPDPDVYVYWDSSQADPRSASRLNLSEYKSAAADTALEAARTRADTAVRTVKYQAFLKAWQEDNPALALYQPVSLYITRGGAISGLVEHSLNTDADRYYSVSEWAVKSGYVPK